MIVSRIKAMNVIELKTVDGLPNNIKFSIIYADTIEKLQEKYFRRFKQYCKYAYQVGDPNIYYTVQPACNDYIERSEKDAQPV